MIRVWTANVQTKKIRKDWRSHHEQDSFFLPMLIAYFATYSILVAQIWGCNCTRFFLCLFLNSSPVAFLIIVLDFSPPLCPDVQHSTGLLTSLAPKLLTSLMSLCV